MYNIQTRLVQLTDKKEKVEKCLIPDPKLSISIKMKNTFKYEYYKGFLTCSKKYNLRTKHSNDRQNSFKIAKV